MAKIDLTQHPPFVYPDYRSSVLRGPHKRLLNLNDMCKQEPRVQLSEMSGSLANKFSTSKTDNNLLLNSTKNGTPLGEDIYDNAGVIVLFLSKVYINQLNVWNWMWA